MALTTYRYAFDPTGSSTDNHITDEVPTLLDGGRDKRLIVPQYPPFYAKDLQVINASNGTVLQHGVDYEYGDLRRDVTEKTGLEAYNDLILINTSVTNVKLNYRTVGGHYQDTKYVSEVMREDIENNYLTVEWDDVIGKPSEYQPEFDHRHLWKDVVGVGPIKDVFDRIEKAVANYYEQYKTIVQPLRDFEAETRNKMDNDFVQAFDIVIRELNKFELKVDSEIEQLKQESLTLLGNNFNYIKDTIGEAYTYAVGIYNALKQAITDYLNQHHDNLIKPLNDLKDYLDIRETNLDSLIATRETGNKGTIDNMVIATIDYGRGQIASLSSYANSKISDQVSLINTAKFNYTEDIKRMVWLDGPTGATPGTTVQFTIVNYNSFINYSFSFSDPSLVSSYNVVGNILNLTLAAKEGTLEIYGNGLTYISALLDVSYNDSILKPSVLTPDGTNIVTSGTYTLTFSPFTTTAGQITHTNTFVIVVNPLGITQVIDAGGPVESVDLNVAFAGSGNYTVTVSYEGYIGPTKYNSESSDPVVFNFTVADYPDTLTVAKDISAYRKTNYYLDLDVDTITQSPFWNITYIPSPGNDTGESSSWKYVYGFDQNGNLNRTFNLYDTLRTSSSIEIDTGISRSNSSMLIHPLKFMVETMYAFEVSGVPYLLVHAIYRNPQSLSYFYTDKHYLMMFREDQYVLTYLYSLTTSTTGSQGESELIWPILDTENNIMLVPFVNSSGTQMRFSRRRITTDSFINFINTPLNLTGFIRTSRPSKHRIVDGSPITPIYHYVTTLDPSDYGNYLNRIKLTNSVSGTPSYTTKSSGSYSLTGYDTLKRTIDAFNDGRHVAFIAQKGSDDSYWLFSLTVEGSPGETLREIQKLKLDSSIGITSTINSYDFSDDGSILVIAGGENIYYFKRNPDLTYSYVKKVVLTSVHSHSGYPTIYTSLACVKGTLNDSKGFFLHAHQPSISDPDWNAGNNNSFLYYLD